MHLPRRQFRLRHNPIFHFYHKFQKGCVNVDAALLGLLWEACDCCVFLAELADTARRVPTKNNKKHRAGTKRIGAVGFVRLLQLSAAGEVFLEGTCPLSRRPQTAKFSAPYFWRTGKVGEKSDSFSRAERTRPLRPVSRLQHGYLENVPVEHFQQQS